jgi:hypothetical protein
MYEKVVVRFNDGRLAKGLTEGHEVHGKEIVFSPAEDPLETVKIPLRDVKAVFYVKSFYGAMHRAKPTGFLPGSCVEMTPVEVEFRDGERLWACAGTAELPTIAGYFSVQPADPDSNNERVFVPPGGVRSIVQYAPSS